jgi:hypothetical protein
VTVALAKIVYVTVIALLSPGGHFNVGDENVFRRLDIGRQRKGAWQ